MPKQSGKSSGSSVALAVAAVGEPGGFEILGSLPFPVVIMPADYPYVGRQCQPLYINEAYSRFIATSGRISNKLSDEDYLKMMEQLATGSMSMEVAMHMDDGLRYYRLSGQAIPQGILLTVLDLTPEHEARHSADQQEVLYRSVLEATHEGFWEIDIRAKVRYWCPRIRAALGLTPDEQITDETRKRFCHPADYAVIEKAYHDLLHYDVPLRCEARWLMQDNEYHWMLIAGTCFRDLEGHPVRLIGTVLDIHERKIAEQKVIDMNRLLETRIAQRTRELADTNAELQSFCYSVSHDLRGPLRSINGFGKALEEDYADALDEEGRDYIARIRKASLRLSGLIDALLSLSRITRAEMRRELINVGDLFQEAYEDQQRVNPTRKVLLTMQGDLSTYGDASLLRLVVNNLMENAWKFSAKSAEPHIEIFRTTQGDAFCIRDNGAGFDMAFASKLFAPFERLHAESEFPGTGIGLAVVQRVIQRHMGEIWAQSQPGKGASFFFTLPSRKRGREG